MVFTELIDLTIWTLAKTYDGLNYLIYGNVDKKQREATMKHLDKIEKKENELEENMKKMLEELKQIKKMVQQN